MKPIEPSKAIKMISNLINVETAICRRGYATQAQSEKERRAIRALYSAITGANPSDAELTLIWDSPEE